MSDNEKLQKYESLKTVKFTMDNKGQATDNTYIYEIYELQEDGSYKLTGTREEKK